MTTHFLVGNKCLKPPNTVSCQPWSLRKTMVYYGLFMLIDPGLSYFNIFQSYQGDVRWVFGSPSHIRVTVEGAVGVPSCRADPSAGTF